MRGTESNTWVRVNRGPHRARAWWVPALLGAALLAGGAQAATYTTPEGLSMEYPDGWSVNTNANGNPGKTYDKGIELTAILRDQSGRSSRFTANITIVISRERMIANQANLRAAKKELPGMFESKGLKTSGMDGEVIEVAGRKGLSLMWDATAMGIPIRQWQVQTSGNKKAYAFTFSADASEFSRHEAAFRKAVASIRVPGEPDSDLFGFSGGIVSYTIAGALIGGLVGLLVWLVKRSNKPQPAMATWQGGPAQGAPPMAPPLPAAAAAQDDAQFIKFLCPCGQKIKVPLAHSGKKGKCPACQSVVQIP